MEETPSNVRIAPEVAEAVKVDAALDELIGSVIDNRYEVMSLLGSGGMGAVYRVHDRLTGNDYALKMISPELAAEQKILAKRLEHEAIAAKTLTHANIVAVYDVGKSNNDAPYLIMDLIEGEGLDQILKKEVVLPPRRALNLFVQIADALVHANYKGVVHRDLKPSNILVKSPGTEDIVKIADFGIAKISDKHTGDKTKLTQTGEFLGSPLYMSPEQCKGDELDCRADIYSFGCVMYEVLTGKPPFTDANPVKVILKHISSDAPPFSKNSGVSADLRYIVLRCLRKDADDRYPTPQALATDLERVRDRRPIHRQRANFRFTHKHAIACGAAAIITSMAVVGGLLLVRRPVAPPAVAPVLVQQQHRPETYAGKSLEQWTDAIEKSPDNPQLYYNRGTLHAIRDERTNAIDDYSQAIALKPDFLQALYDRTQQYVMVANYDKALSDADTLIKLDPTGELGYEGRSFVYEATERYPLAIPDLTKAINIDDSAYNSYSYATDLYKMGNYRAAKRAIAKAIADEPASSSYCGLSGFIDTLTGDWKGAEQKLMRAAGNPDARGVEWAELAYLYVCTGRTAEAEKAIAQAKALETFPARSYRLAGELYRTAGMFDKAIKEFSASTSLEEYPPGYRERAVSYISMGQLRSAYADLKKSLQLNPYSPITLSWAARVESELGMAAAAREHITAAFKDGAVPPIVLANRAAMALHDGALSAALADANLAIEHDPFLKEAYELRSKIQERMGNKSAAEGDAAKASQLISHFDL